jgi:hypothetical protein
MGAAIGIVLSIVFFGSLVWFAIVTFVDRDMLEETTWLTNVPGYALLVLITGFIGFIIGAMLN